MSVHRAGVTGGSAIDRKVAEAKADIVTAQAARARAEHEYKVAKAQADAAARDLRDEFGATGSMTQIAKQARERIVALEAELEAECSRVREALSRVGQHADLLDGSCR